MRVARWYCQQGHTSFSLLPDCLASQLSGSLDEVEQVVTTVEAKVQMGSSMEMVAGAIRPDIELPGALRWVRRRLTSVRLALLALVTLMPGQLGNEPRLLTVREALETGRALVRLREVGAVHLAHLTSPIGFGGLPHRVRRRLRRRRGPQHKTGPDPPRSSR